eukprot:6455664-Amphidinium_carterae.2
MGNFPKLPQHDARPHPRLPLRAFPQARAPVRAFIVEDGLPDHPPLSAIDGIQHIKDEPPEMLHVAVSRRRAGEAKGRQIFGHLVKGRHLQVLPVGRIDPVRARQGPGELAPAKCPIVGDFPPTSLVVRNWEEGARVLGEEILKDLEDNLQIVLTEPQAGCICQMTLRAGQLFSSKKTVSVAEIPL